MPAKPSDLELDYFLHEPDQSDGANATTSDEYGASTLAEAQAEAEFAIPGDPTEPVGDWRRCIFRHDVLASHGYETRAGFVCYGHSRSFDSE